MTSKPPMSPGVLVFGDVTVDILARLGKFAGLGGDYLVPALEPHCGGVGANVALALAKWGVLARLLGCLGRDWFGDFALACLERARIETTFVQRTERALTGLMFIAVSADGQRTMFGSRGANERLTPAANWECLEGMEALHLVGYDFLVPAMAELARELLEEARRRRALVSLDVGLAPAQEIPQVILQAAKKADILCVNQDEAAALTGKKDKREAFSALEQCTGGEVVLKLGANGALMRSEGELCEVPPFSVPTVDSTGAGDAFAAAFLRARLHGWSGSEAALLANAAGAAAASVLGAGEVMPEPREVLALLRASQLAGRWEAMRVRVLGRLSEELSP